MKAPLKVESLMSTALVTVRDSDTVGAANLEMKLGAMRHVPVVDDKHNLVGVLSSRDLIAALAAGHKKERVGAHMSRKLITVTPETYIYQAIDLLLEHRFGSLPVVGSDGQLVGIVTETDFLQATRDLFAPDR